ncbi:MAG TPA: hypothetical protein VIG29_16815, partial [Vicinamibacteria bacterium]
MLDVTRGYADPAAGATKVARLRKKCYRFFNPKNTFTKKRERSAVRVGSDPLRREDAMHSDRIAALFIGMVL